MNGPEPPAPLAQRGRGRGLPDAGLSFILTLVVGLTSAVVVSRLYGVEVIGLFALASAPYALVSVLSSVGEQVALVKALSTEEPGTRRTASVFAVVLTFSTAYTTLAAAVAAPVVAALLRGPVDRPDALGPALVLLGGYVLLHNASWNTDRLLSAFGETRAMLRGRVFDVVLLLVASITAAQLGRDDVWGLTLATVFTFAAGLLLRVHFARAVLKTRPTRSSLRDAARELPGYLRFGVKLVPGAFADAFSTQAATFLIAAVRPVGVLGSYSRANNLASRLTEAGYRLGEVILPVLSRACHERRHAEASVTFSRWRLLVTVLLLGVCAPLGGAGERLLTVFGPGFSQEWLALGLLLLAYTAGVVSILHAQFLVALGHPAGLSYMSLLRAGLSLTALVPATLLYGATGTAVAVLLGYVAELLGLLHLTRSRLAAEGVSLPSLPWLDLIAATGAAVAVSRGLDVLLGSFSGALLAAAAGGAVFAAVVLLRGLLRLAEVRTLFRAMRRRG